MKVKADQGWLPRWCHLLFYLVVASLKHAGLWQGCQFWKIQWKGFHQQKLGRAFVEADKLPGWTNFKPLWFELGADGLPSLRVVFRLFFFFSHNGSCWQVGGSVALSHISHTHPNQHILLTSGGSWTPTVRRRHNHHNQMLTYFLLKIDIIWNLNYYYFMKVTGLFPIFCWS